MTIFFIKLFITNSDYFCSSILNIFKRKFVSIFSKTRLLGCTDIYIYIFIIIALLWHSIWMTHQVSVNPRLISLIWFNSVDSTQHLDVIYQQFLNWQCEIPSVILLDSLRLDWLFELFGINTTYNIKKLKHFRGRFQPSTT